MPARHLLIRLEQDDAGYPPYSAEELDATQLGDDRVRLEVVPSFAFGLAKGDIVRAEAYDDELWIVELLEPNDLVITADIPLAAATIEKRAHALNPRGELYTTDNIRERLSMRNFMDELRGSGVATGGPAPLNARDRQAFANSLDRFLTAHAPKVT